MPTYQYQCRDCGNSFDRFQKFAEDPLTVCPSCGGTVARVIQNVGVVFKGSGWYINDSRKPSESSSSAEKPAAEKSANGDVKTKTADAGATTPAKTEKTEKAKTPAASAAE